MSDFDIEPCRFTNSNTPISNETNKAKTNKWIAHAKPERKQKKEQREDEQKCLGVF